MYRHLKACLVLLTLVVGLIGGVMTAQAADLKGEITIVSWPTWDAEAFAQVVKGFNETYPNVHVNWTLATAGVFQDKVLSMIAGGSPIDILYVNSAYVMQWQKSNYLEDLTPYIKRYLPNFRKGEYVYGANVWDMGDGRIYGLGLEAFAYYFYYNTDHFSRFGLPFPTRGWTWDDFLATAKKLTVDKQFAIQSGASLTRTYPWVWQNGGAIWDKTGSIPMINKPETINAFQLQADQINVHKIVGGNFDKQTASMIHTGHFNIPRPGITKWDALRWGTVVPPKGPAGEAATLNVEGWGMLRTSTNKDAAAAFITWAASPVGQKTFAQYLGTLPNHIPTMSKYAYAYLDNDQRLGVINTISQVAEIGRCSWGSLYEDALAPFNTELNLAFKGQKSVQQAVDASYSQVLELVAQLKAQYKK